ncbi:ABC transporter substrate-binding protein [Spirillospora sp. NPDC052242]
MSLILRMRPLAFLAAAVLGLTASAGCSAAADPHDGGEAPTSAGYPVTVTTGTGETTLTERPERVVTLGNPAFENVIALGIDPVGAGVNNIENLPYLAEHDDHAAIDATLADPYANEIDYEGVLALKPDLIVAPAWPQFTDEAVVAKLEQVAPTLVFDMQDAGADWRAGIRQVAKAVAKVDEGERLITAAVTAFEEVGAKHPRLTRRPYSFGLYYNSEITLASAGNVLRLFGMRPAADQRAVEEGSEKAVYSGETVGDVEGEVVLLMPSPRESAATLEASPAWATNLSERVVWLSDPQGEAINNAGVLGKTWVPGDLDALFGSLG